MGNDIVIECENLGKKFRLGERQAGYKTLRDLIARSWGRAGSGERRRSGQPGADQREFWALSQVSFQVRRGEAIGIIGHNGAGKSTLLKILSRITYPTEGEACLKGRVGALLEVGTGFNPELTGRENIYLNGAILGMHRSEIAAKFNEIVAFAGVEAFIDTPIKHYSTGMGLRLGFAVAAHLEPEILVVDEVLAVGDAEFQRKCLGKMQDVTGQGRTVLFVSHNLGAVRSLCSRALWLKSGILKLDGPVDSVIEAYLSDATQLTTGDLFNHPNRRKGVRPVIARIRLLNSAGQPVDTALLGDPVVFELKLDPQNDRYPAAHVGIVLHDRFGQPVCEFNSTAQSAARWSVRSSMTVQCLWPECLLMPGSYTASVAFRSGETKDAVDNCFQFQVLPQDIFETGRTNYCKKGFFVPKAQWKMGDEKFSGDLLNEPAAVEEGPGVPGR